MCKSSNKIRVAVIGGGISALSAAYRILETYSEELELRVLAKERYEKTATYSAGGIWFPLGNFGPEAEDRLPQIRQWFAETGSYYEKLIGNSIAFFFLKNRVLSGFVTKNVYFTKRLWRPIIDLQMFL